jgi:alpha-1,3-fucosyltransferase
MENLFSKNVYVNALVIFVITVFLNGFFILNIISDLKNDFFFSKENLEDLNKNYRTLSNQNLDKCNPIVDDSASYSVEINQIRYPQYVSLHANKSINFECLNKSREIKRILFWTTWFGDDTFGVGLGIRKPFENLNCQVTNCELLNDKTRINESDYVVAHMWDIWDTLDKIPTYRPKFQRWIFMTYESPIRSYDYSRFNGVFNLSSTYMVNSDFPGMYQIESDFIWKKNESFDKDHNFTQGKKGFAVAVISNCRSDEKSNRFDYIKEMKNYVSVDVFGKCGDKCPTHFGNNKTGDCKEILGTQYKFYLAFENSICKDYVTEKFFGILKFNIIPVVLGGGSYNKFVRLVIYFNLTVFFYFI